MPDKIDDGNSDVSKRAAESERPNSAPDRIQAREIILISVLTLYLAGCVYLSVTRPGRGTEDWHTAIGMVVFAFYAVIGSFILAPIIALLSIHLNMTKRTATWVLVTELLLIMAFWFAFLVPRGG